jgi:hypothetical protein
MRTLVGRFIDSCVNGRSVDCDLFTEAHVAAVSRALEAAARTRSRATPQMLPPPSARNLATTPTDTP